MWNRAATLKATSSLFLLFLLTLGSCGYQYQSKKVIVNDCRQSLSGMLDLLDEAADGLTFGDVPYFKLTKALRRGGPRQPDWFDVNAFFSVLPRLELQEGYTLDYMEYGAAGRWPILYARRIGEYPYTSLEEFRIEREELFSKNYETHEMFEYAYDRYTYSYLEHIVTDGTPAGFVEFILLLFLGDRFYIDAPNYLFPIPVCNTNDLFRVIRFASQSNRYIPEGFLSVVKGTRNLDLSPTVEYNKGVVLVNIFVVGYKGLEKVKVKISEAFPHILINNLQYEIIIEKVSDK